MRPSEPHLFFFTCLTPDDFTCQWGSSATQWVKLYKLMPSVALKIARYFQCYSNYSFTCIAYMLIQSDSLLDTHTILLEFDFFRKLLTH